MLLMDEISGKRVGQGNSRVPSVSREQPPALRHEKFSTGCSDNRRHGQEVLVSFTQWLPISSYKVLGPYDDIEYKQTTCVLLDAARHRYVHRDTTHRTETCLKR
ncbi:hypothetical protein TNCV_4305561 [Trichonephila clavipes]|nr:hypothetical protein TNCV_4305561 [Trichonephila clavipes]